jgi:hypothetical protein
MKNLPPNLTPAQVRAYTELERISMAWVVLKFLLVVFSLILVGFAYAVFWGKAERLIQIGFALLDGIVGTSITRIVWNLFPTKSKP